MRCRQLPERAFRSHAKIEPPCEWCFEVPFFLGTRDLKLEEDCKADAKSMLVAFNASPEDY